MGLIWGRQDPGGPHVGPMNFVIWDSFIQRIQSEQSGRLGSGQRSLANQMRQRLLLGVWWGLRTWPWLVLKMACCLFGSKPETEPNQTGLNTSGIFKTALFFYGGDMRTCVCALVAIFNTNCGQIALCAGCQPRTRAPESQATPPQTAVSNVLTTWPWLICHIWTGTSIWYLTPGKTAASRFCADSVVCMNASHKLNQSWLSTNGILKFISHCDFITKTIRPLQLRILIINIWAVRSMHRCQYWIR